MTSTPTVLEVLVVLPRENVGPWAVTCPDLDCRRKHIRGVIGAGSDFVLKCRCKAFIRVRATGIASPQPSVPVRTHGGHTP